MKIRKYRKGWLASAFLFYAQLVLVLLLSERAAAQQIFRPNKKVILQDLSSTKPGQFGETIPGIKRNIKPHGKQIALTFDACGSVNGNVLDRELIAYLRKERIPATLFVSGKWIRSNLQDFQDLAADTLFEIENHGFEHKPCSLNGKSKYGIAGTASLEEAYDEIEQNEALIEKYTHRRPLFYRPGTAYADEGCVALASALHLKIVGYSVLSGDAVTGVPADDLRKNILKGLQPGSIVILHMNHPERNTFEALQAAMPEIKRRGFTFVKLQTPALR